MARVRYGLRNLVYAIVTEDSTGKLTFGDVSKIPGAKEMNFSPEGDETTEYADDGVWYDENANNGYSGTLSFEDTAEADAFLTETQGHTKDKNGAVVEKSTDTQKLFAVGGQMTLAGGKETGKRVWFYRCKASRPSVAGKTKEKSPEVQSNSLTVKAMPRLDTDDVKATCVSTDACYSTFFDKVYEPTYDAATSTGTGA